MPDFHGNPLDLILDLENHQIVSATSNTTLRTPLSRYLSLPRRGVFTRPAFNLSYTHKIKSLIS